MIDDNLFKNAIGVNGTELLNKLIELNGDIIALEKRIAKVHEIMSNSDPDDDLEQSTLENVIFEVKSKIKLYKDRYLVIESGLNEIMKNASKEVVNMDFLDESINKEKELFNTKYESVKEIVKRISSMAIKWEVGGSELVKKLIKDVKEVQENNIITMFNVDTSLNEIRDVINMSMKEIEKNEDEIDELKKSIQELKNTIITQNEMNKFKSELSDFLNKNNSKNSNDNKRIINFVDDY